MRSISEFHIRKDATYIAPASMDIKDIYNKFEEPTFDTTDLSLEDIILKYFRACPLHRNDTKIGYIVLNEKEIPTSLGQRRDQVDQRRHRDDTWLPEPLPAHPHPSAGYRCRQLTDYLMHLVGINDKIDINWKKDYFGQKLYLIAIPIKVDEPRTRNILRPYRRDSSQHQELELNQPTSTPPLHVPSIGKVLAILRGPTSQYIYDKVNHPGIVSSHVFDQTAISGPLNSHAHSLISLCAHDTLWSKAHRHIQMYFPHMMNIIKWQEETTSTSKTLGRTSATSSTSTLTTNIMHSKGATITIKYNDDIMEID